MKTYDYLYGPYKDDVLEIPQEIIQNRLTLLKKYLQDNLKVDFRERNSKLIKDLCDAIEFWENINEIDKK